jgi:hypothetical protein
MIKFWIAKDVPTSPDGLLLWVDADIRFAPTAHLEQLFKYAPLLPAIAAVAAESSATYLHNYYQTQQKHLQNWYRPLGLNTGVLLINTTSWNAARQVPNVPDSWKHGMESLPLGDQFVFNNHFAANRHQVSEIPLGWNWRGVNNAGFNARDGEVNVFHASAASGGRAKILVHLNDVDCWGNGVCRSKPNCDGNPSDHNTCAGALRRATLAGLSAREYAMTGIAKKLKPI